ncbi:hypothetical protein Tco_0928956 [Tanacetum coccineum]
MASESSSQQQPKLTPTSNVHFECEDSHIAFKNSIALLESKIPLYNDMLQFLSNSCISTALTKQLQHTTRSTLGNSVKCKYVARNTGKGRKNEENAESYETLRRNPYDSVTP